MRIVVVDSDPVSGKIIQIVLAEAGNDVVLAGNATLAFSEILSRETDLVLLDIELPGMDGYHFCKELRARRFNGPVIFVSERHEARDQLRAFDIGADDYIVEPFHPQLLIARVETVARRCKQSDFQALGTVLKVGDAELSIGQLTYHVDGREPVLLTPTEMRMLECLMRNSYITISRDTLIERTWGYDFGGDSNRVDVYIRRLRRKVERDIKNPEYIHTIRGIGYVFRPPAEDRLNGNSRDRAYPIDEPVATRLPLSHSPAFHSHAAS